MSLCVTVADQSTVEQPIFAADQSAAERPILPPTNLQLEVVELWLEAAGNDLGGGEHILRRSLRLRRISDLAPTNHEAHLLRLQPNRKEVQRYTVIEQR